MILLYACGKERAGISDIPQLTYESIEVEQSSEGKDSMVHITVRFSDGDGDIGLGDQDSTPPFDINSAYWQNLPVRIMHKVGGDFEELLNPLTNEPFALPSERIPRITPEGKNKTITGRVTVHIPANPLNTQPKEVKYELQLIDRALNRSNLITSPTINLQH